MSLIRSLAREELAPEVIVLALIEKLDIKIDPALFWASTVSKN